MGSARPSTHLARLPSGNSGEAQAGFVALRRSTLIGAAIAAALAAIWAGAATWCLLNGDTLAAQLFAQQSAMQHGYEEKIAALRTQLDRVTSQKLVEQNGIDGRLADIARKQALLEARQAALSGLVDEAAGPSTTGSIKPLDLEPQQPDPFGGLSAYAPQTGKPTPVPDMGELRMRDSLETPGSRQQPAEAKPERQSKLPVRERVAALGEAMGEIELAQLRSAQTVLRRSEQRFLRLRSIIAETGIDPSGFDAGLAKAGLGGPFVPVPSDDRAGPFESTVGEAHRAVTALRRLHRATTRLPLTRPTAGPADLTSGFGVRLDPFTRGPAMHTGLDFRAEYGAAAKATAPGRVISAEYAGGYGNMVEVDHGNGVTTRYAHLSEIGVVPGQSVASGAVLGRVGSTGRSTASHLHYETRIDGVPVDPQRFLRAGTRLASALALP
jgi:murein DD-endopeptidase MepM/ murein hydrolase activator NlpD